MLGGCLPSSCARSDNYSLLPADSLSRQIAASVDPGTLEHIETIDLSDALSMPQTLAVDARTGDVYVAAPRRNRVAHVVKSTNEIRTVEGDFESPYLAGFRGDTLGVFNAFAGRMMLMADGEVLRTIDFDMDRSTSDRMAVLGDRRIFVKDVSESSGATIFVFDDGGRLIEEVPMDGPYWRHSGSLRILDGDVFSISGYRPVLYVLREGRIDTLALVGFDSPMLSRSRRFLEEGNFQPPLLSSSAVVVDDRLFAINLRPGWIQIDTYGRDGRLTDVWIEADPQPNRRFYPVDIDAVPLDDGAIDLYVLVQQPAARISRYRIPPPSVARN